MYASRYQSSHSSRPIGLTAAVAINAGVIALLLTANPSFVVERLPRTIEAINIPLTPPPDPVEPPTSERAVPRPTPLPVAEKPLVALPIPATDLTTTATLPDVTPPLDLGANGTATAPPADPPARPAPVLVDASVDPRFAHTLQPDYPAAERRAEVSGTVRVRVLIGADGRVKAVERVTAASDGLFEATRRQALSRWRFRPATRDGAAVESWKAMTVRFELD
jgi:periplasmic protein TonB